MDKNEFLKNVQWVRPLRSSTNKSDADVTVIISSTDIGHPYSEFIIRGGLAELISDTGYMKVGIFKNRMILAAADKTDGYRLSSNGRRNESIRYCKFPRYEWGFEGDFELKHDSFYEYYYIEKEN